MTIESRIVYGMRILPRRQHSEQTHETINAEVGASIARNYMTYSTSVSRERAISVPTISRSRDLIASLIGASEITQHALQFDGQENVEVPLPAETWMNGPDPAVTRNFILSWTFDDLFFYGRAFWGVTARYANGFPSAFTWLPAADVQTGDQAGPLWYGPSDRVTFNGQEIPSRDLVQFLSPIQSVLTMGARAIQTAIRLDQAADRFASNEIPAGWLKQTSGEPMSGAELADLATAWSEARSTNSIAALNDSVEWVESSQDPSKLQLSDARNFQSLALANVSNIPPYLVGAPTGSGMTYQNAEQARQDLWLFAARPYIDAIEQTLSGDNVIPRGRYIKLDVASFLQTSRAAAAAPTTQPQGAVA